MLSKKPLRTQHAPTRAYNAKRKPILPSVSPNVRQWNREYGVSVSVSHVVCVNFICVGSERKCNFQWNMGLRHRAIREIVDVN